MKKIITLSLLLLWAGSSFAQITIQSTDIPIPEGQANIVDLTSVINSSPSIGANQVWNYGNQQGTATSPNEYLEETDTYFSNAGVDIRTEGTKSFNASFSYYIANGWDFNSNGIDDKGYYVPAQGYDLSSYTSNVLDSLKIPEQKKVLTVPRRFMQFPMTYGTSWSSASRRVTDFTLSVAAYGLSNAPAQHAYTIYRKDTIAGWGKLSVYTSGGASAAYDVLMNKVSSYVIDSFYLNGAPAPTALLSAFSVVQGAKTGVQHFYNFMRKGSVNYFMRFAYGADSTFTTPTGVFVNTDFAYPTQLTSPEKETIQVLSFPNPVSGNGLQLMLQSTTIAPYHYALYDLRGACVAQGEITSGQMQFIPLNNLLSNGMYVLRGYTKHKEQVFEEKIQIQR